jgi:hypothetical protein
MKNIQILKGASGFVKGVSTEPMVLPAPGAPTVLPAPSSTPKR